MMLSEASWTLQPTLVLWPRSVTLGLNSNWWEAESASSVSHQLEESTELDSSVSWGPGREEGSQGTAAARQHYI